MNKYAGMSSTELEREQRKIEQLIKWWFVLGLVSFSAAILLPYFYK